LIMALRLEKTVKTRQTFQTWGHLKIFEKSPDSFRLPKSVRRCNG
jgi:hypothetical protein